MAHQIDEYIEKDMYLNYIDILKRLHSIFKREIRGILSAALFACWQFLLRILSFELENKILTTNYLNVNIQISTSIFPLNR